MIETPRLFLRPYSLEDYESYCAMTSNPAVARFLAPTAMTPEKAWNLLLRNLGHWSAFGFGLFAIFEKETGRFVGETGFLRSHPGLDSTYNNSPIALWILTHQAQGRGIALEAALVAHEWLADIMRTERTVCMIHPRNVSSLRLADKLGYRAIGESSYKDEMVTIFERRASI